MGAHQSLLLGNGGEKGEGKGEQRRRRCRHVRPLPLSWLLPHHALRRVVASALLGKERVECNHEPGKIERFEGRRESITEGGIYERNGEKKRVFFFFLSPPPPGISICFAHEREREPRLGSICLMTGNIMHR
jgi:hypothetical protein